MPQSLLKLVALLLLTVQVVLVPITGRVLCITPGDTAVLAAETPLKCRATHAAGCSGHADAETPDDSKPDHSDSGRHSHDECICHSHVPVPSDERVPGTSRTDITPRPSLVPLAINLALTSDCRASAEPVPAADPPDLSGSDLARTLASTRLLI